MSREHTLKTLPDYWQAVADGDKNFEVRRDDRGFQKGDILVLCKIRKSRSNRSEPWEFDPTVTPVRRRITYILTGNQFGIEAGFVVMGLEPV